MPDDMKRADPLTHPLQGMSLVESSAGTGKTTLLVRLYLRALLREKLTLDRILAVTYTRAATGELSVRIRNGLIDAARNLEQSPPDSFWKALFAGADKGELQQRIEAALAAFDDKGVFTIHGFCQRMLADNAFEAGTAFASEEAEDEDALRAEVAADFWRRRVGTEAPLYVKWFVDAFKSPGTLVHEKLAKALQVSGPLGIEPTAEPEDMEAAINAFESAARKAREEWDKECVEVEKILRHARERGLNARTYNEGAVNTLLAEWRQWLAGQPILKLPDKFSLMTASKLGSATRKNGKAPVSPFFDAAETLLRAAEALAALWWQATAADAFEFIREEFRRRKRTRRERGFDDILRELRDALCDGKSGAALARRIAGQYPLVLVDEFQDTDPLQYDIFKAIHEAGGGEHGLVLIGDPKQAIYRFRGADIATYIRARGECRHIYRLTENYRSAPQLLTAVNALFGNAGKPFEYESIGYESIETGRKPPRAPLELDEGADTPTTVVAIGKVGGTVNKNDVRRRAAVVCAGEIARLIRLGGESRARLDGKPVEPGDIAVLVGTNRQGFAVQEALRKRGISAAMVATQSVFASTEAGELESLLAAVAEPTDGRLLRRALATRLLGATAADLAEWVRNEDAWAVQVERFRGYHQLWQERDATIMLARLLREERVIERTLARPDGERAMTNLRHLVELIGAEAARRPGVAPLLAWFGTERSEDANEETRQLRLESDESLVRVATIHKAKGLQYPIVFLPFLWDGSLPRASKPPAVLAHDERNRPVLDLGSPTLEERRAEAARDARSEEARKTYVALTRAERACYILATAAGQCEKSAFGCLLGIKRADEFCEGLKNWKRAAQGTVAVREPVFGETIDSSASSRRCGEARAFGHPERLQRRFHVASYSLLASGVYGAAAEEPEHDEAVPVPQRDESATGIHAFPAGAASGTFMHELIEKLPFNSDREAISRAAAQALASHGFDAERWTKGITEWLLAVFATSLGAPRCRLADIADSRRVNEMEFRFVLNRIEALALEKAVAGFAPQVQGPKLDFKPVAGQMKGYLDLTFEHGGRFWVVDYKSNWLGNDLTAYTPAALDRAMAEHRYDLQYLLYTVALNRYLETRVPGYDYEEHFGGVLYLFLRGMAPDAPEPRGVWHTRPARADLRRLDALLSGETR